MNQNTVVIYKVKQHIILIIPQKQKAFSLSHISYLVFNLFKGQTNDANSKHFSKISTVYLHANKIYSSY